jgi:uncharacterized membrane protein YukC
MFDDLERRADAGDKRAKRLLSLIGWGLTTVLILTAIAFVYVAFEVYQMYMDQSG